MAQVLNLNGRIVGDGAPCYIIAEIGINHNGSLETAMRLIDVAKAAGCDAVKFQKRTPEKCVPADQRDKMRETPWGYISYMEYRHKVEFGREEFERIDNYCRAQKIAWFVSCWDTDSVDFMKQFKTPCIKIPSASLTDRELLESCKGSGHALMLSTGMSSMDQIEAAVRLLGTEKLLLAHATSTYPCPKEQLNLQHGDHAASRNIPARSAIQGTKSAWSRPWPPWPWAPVSSSGTSRSTGQVGEAIRPLRSSRRACAAWSKISAASKPPWATV